MIKVILLAAGIGKRLINGNKDVQIPKCLVELETSKTILKINLEDLLSFREINDISIITGFKHKVIDDYLQANFPDYQNNIKTIYNPEYKKSVVFSVIKGFENIGKEKSALLLNGDTYFFKDVFDKVCDIADSNPDTISLFGHISESYYNDDILVEVVDKKVINIGKNLKTSNAVSSGAILLCNRGFDKYLDTIRNEPIQNLKTHHGIIQRIQRSGYYIEFIDLGVRSWLEVDTKEDLIRARNQMNKIN